MIRVGDVLDDERHRVIMAFRQTFTVCPDPTGAGAPCDWSSGVGMLPVPETPYATACPLASTIECAPHCRERDRRSTRDAQEARARGTDDALRRGIPVRFIDATLRGEQTLAVQHVRAFLNDDAQRGRALVLLGPPGTGKTYAAAAAIHAWPSRARLLETDRIGRLVFDHDALAETTADAEGASLLALDDLGRGYTKVGGLAEGVLEELVVYRHAHMRATIITSNLTPAQLAERLTPRLVDRFREWATIVAVPAGSLRGRA